MKKSGANAAWFGLSVKGRAQVEEWLFEEKMNYTTAWERAQKELGFKGSVSSLKRYYKRVRQERMLADFAEAAAMAEKLEGVTVSAERMQTAGMKLAAQLFLKQIAEQPDNPKEWAFLAKLLLQQRDIEVRERLKTEENAIRQRCLDFAQVRFQFDTMTAARDALPELLELDRAEQESRKSPQERLLEGNRRMNDVRRRMFGEVIPELLPETAEELAHPEIIVERFEEGKRRMQLQWAQEMRERMAEYDRLKKERGESGENQPSVAGCVLESDEDRMAREEEAQEEQKELTDEEKEAAAEKERKRRERDEVITRLLRERRDREKKFWL